jgi:hypothetical protein
MLRKIKPSVTPAAVVHTWYNTEVKPMPVYKITLCRCTSTKRQANIRGLNIGDTVRFERDESAGVEEKPMVVYREDGIDIGEVPVKIARSILGNNHRGSVTGLKPLSFGVAPLVELKTPEIIYSSVAPIERRAALIYSVPAHARSSRRQPQTGPNAAQILVLIVIAAVSLVLGMSGIFESGKSVHVHGYTRSNGTHVSGYDRAAPGTK